ncbi:hypothetical protein H1R20_g10018, partial [Candolleomyces eurysporus]
MIFSRTAFISLLGLVASTAAQQSSNVVCIAGQCVQGFSNTTIGAKLTAPGSSTSLHLLPGQYTSTTNPQLLHNLLTSSSASLASSAGLSANGPITSLPLDLALQPGLAIYSEPLYSGQDAFSGLPSTPVNNISLPIGAKSIALSSNVWVAISSSNNDGRTILWDSVPDVSQLSLSSSLNLLDIQSTSCSPSCSGAGICSAAGQCVCPSNFGGSSCESCAAGHFGPQCQPCPDGCDKCDEGMAGTGRCLTPQVGPTDPKRCNCVNGECNPDGTCTCSNGWVDGSDGTKCASCAAGFFRTSTGDCSACQLGCVQCSENTGICNACKTGFTLNLQDRTKCDPAQGVLSTGQPCPAGSFSDGSSCVGCSDLCETCNAAGDGGCLTCAVGFFMSPNGRCVQADNNGICSGSDGLIADNIKRVCDTCPNKCSSCQIPNFSRASTISELQCTECLPGSFLFNGKCVDTCPDRTFVNPQDNRSCIPCSSSCGTCAGSADFCLTCTGNLLASDGQCVSTCPSGTFTPTPESNTPAGTCLKCHPDCQTCSGPSFNQCSTCPTSRPVLSTVTGATSGRCLPTCNKNQYFDATTKTCQSCDGNCASCSGPGANSCLSCQNSRQIVKGGQCVDASCSSGTGVIPGLGVCLSDLVVVPTTTDGAPPLPTITGLGDPTKVEGGRKLEWWQILLMALGCAFIFVAFLWCCRRRARKQRAKKTAMFAKGKGIQKGSWNWGKLAAGWKLLFSRNKNSKRGATTSGEGELPIAYNHHEVTSRGLGGPISLVRGEDIKMSTLNTGNGSMKDAQARLGRSDSRKSSKKNNRKPHDNDDLESYIDAYDYSRRSLSIHSRTPSVLPDLDGYYPPRNRNYDYDRDRLRREAIGANARDRDLERDSMFSEMTGMSRNTPEPRIPVRRDAVPIGYTDSSNSNSRSGSPVRDVGKLRKVQLHKKTSDETMSSVVIQPQWPSNGTDDATLIDLGDNANKALPQPPLQFQPSPFLASLPIQTPASTGLTAAQMYAMNTRPELIGGGPGAQQTQALPMHMMSTGATASTVATMPLPSGVGLGITTTGGAPLGAPIGTGGGLYWLEPAAGSTNNFVLKPAITGSSTLTGNSQDNSALHEKWVAEYGPTITYKAFFGMNRLFTTDLRALSHMLLHSSIYQKPPSVRYNLGQFLGTGVLIVEGDKHKHQRRIMNPAFSGSQIRQLTEIFIEKSLELRDVWAASIGSQNENGATIDVLSGTSKFALDVICLAGFDYRMDTLNGGNNELNEAFSRLFSPAPRVSFIPLLRGLIPALRWLPTAHGAESKKARASMDRIGRELLVRNKREILNSKATSAKQDFRKRDLLTCLMRANMADDLPEHQRMSDVDVLAQVPTFITAGHETSSTATAWTLLSLAQNQHVQEKLREELFSLDTDNPTMDELNSLPYLESVVRESLRIHSPIATVMRQAASDDILPLGTPFKGRDGKLHHTLRISQGQTILISILAINRSKEIWGEDSFEFKPERWKSLPESVKSVPGVWGNTLSFLAGPRACIGYKFSIIEIKAVLFTLVRAFEFGLAEPAMDVIKKAAIVQRPVLRADPGGGNKLPLVVRPHQRG